MPHSFYFLCPNCLAEDTISKEDCAACRTPVRISGQRLSINGREYETTEYYEFLVKNLSPSQKLTILENSAAGRYSAQPDKAVRMSKDATLRQGRASFRFQGYHQLFQRVIYQPVEIARGKVVFYEDFIEFIADHKRFTWEAGNITCVTTNGHYFEFKIKDEPYYQIHFQHESALKYEILFKKWLDNFYASQNPGRIIEYQPKLRLTPPSPAQSRHDFSPEKKSEKPYLFERWIMSTIAKLINLIVRLWITVEVEGKENWRRKGNGVLLANHQSWLDPFLFSAFCDHRVAFLTKSTSFVNPLARYFLKWAMALPTTRFQTDPEIIQIMRVMIKQGVKIGIFPEGERSWDGNLQPFKLSLVKVLMASRQAIYVVVLENAFRFWPRWAKFPRKANIKIDIKAPFSLIPQLYTVEDQRQFLESCFRVL